MVIFTWIYFIETTIRAPLSKKRRQEKMSERRITAQEIREKHELITRGIYGIIRHPMYASRWLWVIAQTLLLQNWLAGFMDLIIFIPFYYLRVQAEEKMMLDSFGGDYYEYMKKVGAVIPKFGKG